MSRTANQSAQIRDDDADAKEYSPLAEVSPTDVAEAISPAANAKLIRWAPAAGFSIVWRTQDPGCLALERVAMYPVVQVPKEMT